MYQGINTKKFAALMYTSIFCIRRLLLVCTLLVLKLVLDIQGIWLILAYNGLQSLYFWYMTSVNPHVESIHNRLEYFNELCVISMQYTMIFFISGSGVDPEIQWNIGIAVMALVCFVFLVNVLALVYLTMSKLMLWCRVKKARMALFKARELKRALDKALKDSLSSAKDEHNDGMSLSKIAEEVQPIDGSILA